MSGHRFQRGTPRRVLQEKAAADLQRPRKPAAGPDGKGSEAQSADRGMRRAGRPDSHRKLPEGGAVRPCGWHRRAHPEDRRRASHSKPQEGLGQSLRARPAPLTESAAPAEHKQTRKESEELDVSPDPAAVRARCFRRGFRGAQGRRHTSRCAPQRCNLTPRVGPVLRMQKNVLVIREINHLGDEMLSRAFGAVTLTGKRLQNHQERRDSNI